MLVILAVSVLCLLVGLISLLYLGDGDDHDHFE